MHNLYCELKTIPFTLYTYVVAKILRKGTKFIQNLTPGFKKAHEEFEQLQTSSGKSEKLKFDGLLCPKKTFLQQKHYIQRIYLTLLSTTCVKIHQIIYVIFETISHFSRHNCSISF